MSSIDTPDASRSIHQTLPIAIVGGGLGGLALAIGLLKHGINVHIYESASEYSEIGAGVSFGVNSVAALHLIDPKLLEGYKKHATYNANRERDSTFMVVRWGMDEKQASGHGSLAGDLIWYMTDEWHPERAQVLGVRTRSSIHRARLLQELVALIPDGVTSFRKTFESAEELADGRLMLRFTDGTSTLAGALIGCDGIKSKVRNKVWGSKVEATYAGECAYRAMVPKADAEAALGADLAFNGHIYAGYGGYIVTYPVENGDFVNINAMLRDTESNQKWKQDDWTVSITTDEILQRFRGWYAPLIALVSRFHLPSKWALFCLRHNEAYYKGRICLLGDSAHATTPHLGAGAGMAMEDAYVLSSLIASLRNLDNIESAFRAYDAVRRPRTQGVIERSLDAGIKYSFHHPDVLDDTTSLKKQLVESHRWLWHEDLEGELQKAQELLNHQNTPQ